VTDKTFAELGLATPLLTALATAGYETPTPIQAQAIPPVLAGGDLIGLAQTGTGKTAAFCLPILHRLSQEPMRPAAKSCRALIVAPTRELAVQIADGVKTYGRGLGLTHAVILGGVGQNPQVRALARGIDILVATPGRLLDLHSQGHLRLDRTGILVLDEADRMFDMGFIRDVRKIAAALPKRRQTLLFSATMHGDVEKLARDILTDPTRVAVTPKQVTVDRIEQRVLFMETAAKRGALTDMLADSTFERVVVFTRTKHGANRLSGQLEKSGIPADAIHGNKSQNARQRALEAFRSGDVRVLVATDIAARGIDVDGVTHVINFDLPVEPESYVHRIGRTARAGNEGVAISFCAPEERSALRAVERLTGLSLGGGAGNGGSNGGGRPKTAAGKGPRNGGGKRPTGANDNGADRPNRNRRRRRSGGQRLTGDKAVNG